AELPARRSAIHRLRPRREMNDGFARYTVQSAVVENNGIAAHNRLVIVPQVMAGYAAHLEDIHEISFVGQFNNKLKFLEVEIFKRKIIKERIGRQKLFTADVHRILGDLIGFPHGASAGCKFYL